MVDSFVAIILLKHFDQIFKANSLRNILSYLNHHFDVSGVFKDIRKNRNNVFIRESSGHEALHVFGWDDLDLAQKNSLNVFDILIVFKGSQRKSSLFT
jgi:hypothetical protein